MVKSTIKPKAFKKCRHRFKKINERVQELKSDLLIHSKKSALTLNTDATTQSDYATLSFNEELLLQAELVPISSFQVIVHEMYSVVQTTAQLLHHLPFVVQCLLSALEVSSNSVESEMHSSDVAKPIEMEDQATRTMCVIAILKLIVALAREVQNECYPHFPGLLPAILAIIDTKNPELTTQVFKTLATLFALFRTQLLDDMGSIQQFYFSFLGHHRTFVREFAAQTFATLLRRMESAKHVRKYLQAYFVALTRGTGIENDYLRDGTAKLVFELVRGINCGFHSRMSDIFHLLLRLLRSDSSDTKGGTATQKKLFLLDIIQRINNAMKEHTNEFNASYVCEVYEKVLLKERQAMHNKMEDESIDDFWIYISQLLDLYRSWIKYRSGRHISELHSHKVRDFLSNFMFLDNLQLLRVGNKAAKVSMLTLCDAVWWRFHTDDESVSSTRSQIVATFSLAKDTDRNVAGFWKAQLTDYVLSKVSQHGDMSASQVPFWSIFLPSALEMACEAFNQESVCDSTPVAFLLCRLYDFLLAHKETFSCKGWDCVEYINDRLYLKAPMQSVSTDIRGLLVQRAEQLLARLPVDTTINGLDMSSMTQWLLPWRTLKVMSLFSIERDDLECFLNSKNVMAFAKIADNAGRSNPLKNAILTELWRLEVSCTDAVSAVQAIMPRLQSNVAESYSVISFVAQLLKDSSKNQRAVLPMNQLEQFFPFVSNNLRSPIHVIRFVTLELLNAFEPLDFLDILEQDSASTSACGLIGACNLVELCHSLEEICGSVSIENEREIVRLLNRLKVLCGKKETPILYKRIALLHMFGLYHVKFASIWTHIAHVIGVCVRTHANELWPLLATELCRVSLQQHSGNEAKIIDSRTIKDVSMKEFYTLIELEMQIPVPDQITDLSKHHSILFDALHPLSDIVETKTRYFSSLFFAFLRDQYVTVYTDEIESTCLSEMQAAIQNTNSKRTESLISIDWLNPGAFTPKWSMKTPEIRTKLLDFLRVFALFKNMRGAFGQGTLHTLFLLWIMKADAMVSKLALKCLYTFNFGYMMPYKEYIDKVVEDATFRDTLTVFSAQKDAGNLLQEHRSQLLPVLCRLLYAKCVSKKGRNKGDTVAARRAAILTYISALETSELSHFIALTVRPFTSVDDLLVQSYQEYDVSEVSLSKKLGFLNMLEDVLTQLGVSLAPFISMIASLLVSLLREALREKDDPVNVIIENDSTCLDVGNRNTECESVEEIPIETRTNTNDYKKQCRALVLRRYCQLLEQFDASFSSYGIRLDDWNTKLIDLLYPSITHLGKTIIGADKTPVLLELLLVLAKTTRQSGRRLPQNVISDVITCISCQYSSGKTYDELAPEIFSSILSFMEILIDSDRIKLQAETDVSELQLLPLLPVVMDQFVARFESKTKRYNETKYAGSSRKEFSFLCRLSDLFLSGSVPQNTIVFASNLFQLLLPFLQRNHHTSVEDKEHILTLLGRLVPLLGDQMNKYLAPISKHLIPGPDCLQQRPIRKSLVNILTSFVQNGSKISLQLIKAIGLIDDLNAFDPSKIEEIDFERRMTALEKLRGAVNTKEKKALVWDNFCQDATACCLLLSQLMFSMHDNEYSIRHSAQIVMQQYLTYCNDATQLSLDIQQENLTHSHRTVTAQRVLESTVIPCIRSSMKSYAEATRNGFIQLLSTIADMKALHTLSFVPGEDLCKLRNPDDAEVDIYNNLVHIQLHRRRKALQHLTQILSSQKFMSSTIQNFILPIMMHFIYETQSKSQESIQQQASTCVGVAARHLGWTNYLALLRRLLKSIDGHSELENAIIATVCSVVDHFHFSTDSLPVDLATSAPSIASDKDVPSESSQKITVLSGLNRIQQVLYQQIVPMMKTYMMKVSSREEKKSSTLHSNRSMGEAMQLAASKQGRDYTVRIPLALAVVKVYKLYPTKLFDAEFPILLIAFIKLLRSRDEAVRTSARKTLTKIAVEVGPKYLRIIVQELEHTLRDGYMIPVFSYTLHAILEQTLPLIHYAKPCSILSERIDKDQAGTEPSIDALEDCLSGILRITMANLFRNSGVNQDGTEYKSKMKEAKGESSLQTLELLARCINFLPNSMGIHIMITSLVQRYRDFIVTQPAGHEKALQIFRDALKVMARGLSKNANAEQSYVLLYVHHVMGEALEKIRPLTDGERQQHVRTLINTHASDQDCSVRSWQVNEKCQAVAKELATRVNALSAARVQLQPRMTGFDRFQNAVPGTKTCVPHGKNHKESAKGAVIDTSGELGTRLLQELLHFALLILTDTLRSTTTANEIAASLVDPFVFILFRCISEIKSDRGVIQALRCLTTLLHRDDISSLKTTISPLIHRILKILQKAGAGTAGDETVQACYRCMTALLRHRKASELKLTEAQWRVLVNFVRSDIEVQDHQQITFALLKSMVLWSCESKTDGSKCQVDRKLLISEMYDTIQRVGELLIQNVPQSAKTHCISIYVLFVLHYPMSPKRRTQQLRFLLQNLNYQYESGRVGVLQALHALGLQLPVPIVNENLQLLLLPVVLRLVNDESKTCREHAAQVIQVLLRRAGAQELQQTTILLNSWWNAPIDPATNAFDYRLACTAAQVTLILVEARPEIIEKSRIIPDVVLPRTKSFIETCCLKTSHSYEALVEDIFIDSAHVKVEEHSCWQVIFSVLNCMVQTSDKFPKYVDHYLEKCDAFLQLLVNELVVYPHPWVRLTTIQILSGYLKRSIGHRKADTSSSSMIRPTQSLRWVDSQENLFQITTQIIKLLTLPNLSHPLQLEILGILPWLCARIFDMNQNTTLLARDFETDEADDMILYGAGAKQTSFGWIMTRLSYMVRAVSAQAQSTIFKLFAAITQLLDASHVSDYLIHMLNALVRVQQEQDNVKEKGDYLANKSASELEDSPRFLANQVVELLEKKIGSDVFVPKYTFVQQKIHQLRLDRKTKRKQELVQYPERAARRKLHKNEQKKFGKQAKKRKFAVLKGITCRSKRANSSYS